MMSPVSAVYLHSHIISSCNMLLWMTLTVNWLGSAEAFVNESSTYPDVTTASTIIKSSFHSSQMSKFANLSLRCADLQTGQYYCKDPIIDPKTQQAVNCSKETELVQVPCFPVSGLICNGQEHTGSSVGFYKDVECKWTNGKEFSHAVLLSVFLGWLGIDRFYLGYPALGLLKLCTFGFMFLGHLVDMLLISIQVVGPSDGSAYVVDYFGAGLTRIVRDNQTYIKPPDY